MGKRNESSQQMLLGTLDMLILRTLITGPAIFRQARNQSRQLGRRGSAHG